ncbi:MAG: phenyltransferase domain-containing protein [Desulfobacter sp.]|nr:phenyltransferase domain-containing protein [Desulfobacter sp.]WDP83917.1 MAG: phenyltransferase domain-containing protein [Desulfobacter sp.]
MPRIPANIHPEFPLNIDSVTQGIAFLQQDNGDIPWHINGKTDPWDLVESVMGLNIGGCHAQALAGLDWLVKTQNHDGSWYSSYVNGVPEDRTCETHMACYMAVGLFHQYLIYRDKSELSRFWPAMEKGIEFALTLQTGSGEIYWAKSPEGKVDPMSLLAGSSSIFMSLKCGLAIAEILGRKKDEWAKALLRLEISIQENIHTYNVSKSRFSMYWFYPILSGALRGAKAAARVDKYWNKYVIEGQGCRCVSDQPWVTIAETAELVLALHGMGRKQKAGILFSWIHNRVFDDHTFWCGYTYPDMVIWPEDKISWTNAVVLMAADALYGLTPAGRLFDHDAWNGYRYKDLDRD